MSNNIQRLGESLSKRMIKTANAAVGIYTELATIGTGLTLTPDSIQAAIPQGDYLITAGQKLQPGDRVLVAWCGNKPVIVGPASVEQSTSDVTVTHDGQGHVTIDF